ncbi:MAG: acetate kinase [Promicromonosporaceae bacterium]|nr:acetate kinase [Promicromonosporaceae bacterium]
MSTVLVLNSGSSSLKYQLLDPASSEVLTVGLVEKIGEPLGVITHERPVSDFTEEASEARRELPIADHGEALRLVLGLFDEVGPSLASASIAAVGHRVVHGGTLYQKPTIIDDDVVAGIESLTPLAPLHNPANVVGIKVARELLHVPHVAVFDTAFFSTLAASAYTYAIDAGLAERHAIRRYGFHGTSHQFVSQRVAAVTGRRDLRQVILHLGNGASASAVKSGIAVDTSMGLTPLEGLVMGTRSGDLDPAIVFHLQRVAGMEADELDDLLNKRSGLKGLAGISDMREVRAAADAGDRRAIEALDVYRHRLVKYVGAYAAAMGGIDVLTFTAGVGENNPQLRAEVVRRLTYLGLQIDDDKNLIRSKHPRVISPSGSLGPLVMVVPTNEELAIARQSLGAIA